MHICETDENELRPCPADLCEADVLANALTLACKDLSSYCGDAYLHEKHYMARARRALEKT